MTARERIAQALMSSQAVVPPTDPQLINPPAQNPYLLDQPLEDAAQVQGQAAPLHPLVAAIMKHMGLLNIVRNRNNQMTVDPEAPPQ